MQRPEVGRIHLRGGALEQRARRRRLGKGDHVSERCRRRRAASRSGRSPARTRRAAARPAARPSSRKPKRRRMSASGMPSNAKMRRCSAGSVIRIDPLPSSTAVVHGVVVQRATAARLALEHVAVVGMRRGERMVRRHVAAPVSGSSSNSGKSTIQVKACAVTGVASGRRVSAERTACSAGEVTGSGPATASSRSPSCRRVARAAADRPP